MCICLHSQLPQFFAFEKTIDPIQLVLLEIEEFQGLGPLEPFNLCNIVLIQVEGCQVAEEMETIL
jgi:hypothetical protein